MVKKQCAMCITKIASGDSNALGLLYELVGRQMYVTALSVLNDYQLAQDATQEALVKILTSANTLKKSEAAYSWIIAITRNCALDLLRKNGRDIVVDEDTYINYCTSEHSETDTKIDIENALFGLNEVDRQIVILKASSGLSHKEIAEIVGVSYAACQKRYQRAIGYLKEILD